MSDLPTTFKNDVIDPTMDGRRRYRMITNDDGTVSFVDVTTYAQIGNTFGADEINAQNEKINEINNDLVKLKKEGAMPILDYENYLHVFATVKPSNMPSGATFGLSYTATEDCWLVGTPWAPSDVEGIIKISGTPVYYYYYYANTGALAIPTVQTRVKKGDVIEVNSINNATPLHVFKAID